MAEVKIAGNSKLYRDLYVETGGKRVALEDLDCRTDDTPDFTREQLRVVDAFGSGEFSIWVDENGSINVVLE